MADTVRITKASLKESKTCYDGLLLGLREEKDLCHSCRSYHDLPFKRKPQAAMGRDFSQCLLKQEDGFTVPSITDNSMSSERKRKEKAYCQVLSTPASTKRVLLFSSSKLPSSSRGRPALHDSVEATQLYYREVAREYDAAKLRLQEELIAAQEELARVRENVRS